MRDSEKAQVDQSLERYRRRDPELHDEVAKKVQPKLEPELAQAKTRLRVTEAMPAPDEVEERPAVERRVAETIVRPNARPVLVIRDNRATTEFLGPDSQVWKQRIESASARLDRVIPSVGRIEVGNNPDYSWVGTGWLVADDIVVTNRHVGREFARLGSTGFTFRLGLNGGPQTARLDFLEEYERSASLEFSVQTILWIASASEPDVAFLRVKRNATDRPLPSPIPLASSVAPDDFIAAIGYPARDSRVPDQALVRRIFGDVYEKKRLAPGQVMSVSAEELEHDCSTLGGNSGSALINLQTGEAVGLHFSGLFLEANFAVPAPQVKQLLLRVQQGEMPILVNGGAIATPVATPVNPVLRPTPTNAYAFQFQIPVEVTVQIGHAASVSVPVVPAWTATGSGGDAREALRVAREALAGHPDVIDVRLGYRFKRGWITDERVVVVEVREKLSTTELRQAGKVAIPPQVLGIGTDVRTAALPDQLEHLGIDLEALEAPPRPGQYQEPLDLPLDPIKERMKAVFHVSPDSGFPNLKAFLRRVRQRLFATMYEWDVNHISDEVARAMGNPGSTLKMVTQKTGTQQAVEDMQGRLGAQFEHVWASVGSGRIVPSAYHIKVASRDGEELWLSSGNWKDSNQADIDPAGDHATVIAPLREHNREWHAVIANAKLATLFQKYIEWDFKEATRLPLEEALEAAIPDLFVPEAAFMEGPERRVTARYFAPLELDRELDIQPLLTPDRDGRQRRIFIDFATRMVQRATRKVYLENQSFNLLEDNVDEFEAFFGALKDKQRSGVDVRIIFRDAREFGASNGPRQQKLLEHLKDFGFDTDLIRVQRKCHTKGIIVDGSEVLLGSHNLTNAGSLFNRDASLLVRDAEVAAYFEQIFLFDWTTLAEQESDELVGGMRIAQPGEATPAGFRRVSLRDVLGDD